MIFKRQQKHSVLKGQKPVRRGQEARPRSQYWIFYTFLAALGAWFFLISIKGFVAPTLQTWLFSVNGSERNLVFQIESNGMSPERVELIKSLLKKRVLSGTRYELSEVSQQLAKTFPIKSVQLLRTSPDHIVAKIEHHKPMVRLFEIENGFATSEGLVFVDQESANLSEPLPLLTGAVEARSSLETRGASEILISETERQGILESALLLTSLHEFSVPVVSLGWDGYRGLSFQLSEDTKVVIGMAPFKDKLKPLLKLLDEGKISTYKHIELDFNGKIFAKRKV